MELNLDDLVTLINLLPDGHDLRERLLDELDGRADYIAVGKNERIQKPDGKKVPMPD